MAGHRSFKELTSKMSPASRVRAETKALLLALEMELAEMRKALGLSQAEVAETLGVQQAAVAKVEGRADPLVSTVRQYVEAIGGELHLIVRFTDGQEVEIKPRDIRHA